MFFERMARWGKCGAILSAILGLMGCRLWESERYQRLSFAPGVEPIRVLMIGNSLTYYNDLPGLLQQMSAREARPIYVEKITVPYSSLQWHWNSDDSRQRIANGGGGGKWDFVVVQEFSRLPVTDPDQSTVSYSLFNDAIRQAGGKMIVFENWTRHDKEDEYGALLAAYQKIIANTGGILAPIGAAFRQTEQQQPGISLYVDDRHPSDEGTYLAASVLYDVIYGKKSADLPVDLPGPAISESLKRALRKIADEAATAK